MPTYVLRGIDPSLSAHFAKRARENGWPLRALLLALMEAYAAGKIPMPAGPITADVPPLHLPPS